MINMDSFVRVSLLGNKNTLIHLDIVCSDKYSGLWEKYNNFTDIELFIKMNLEEAVKRSIYKIDDTHFILNCKTNSEKLIISKEKWEKEIGKKIILFLPVIQKFMIKTLAGNM